MIECTNLFPECDWAVAHVEDRTRLRINIERHHHIYVLKVDIEQLTKFLDAVDLELSMKPGSQPISLASRTAQKLHSVNPHGDNLQAP